MEKKRIVSVSFQCAGKLFDFDATNLELNNRDQVVVETERGKSLGTVIGPVREAEPNNSQAKLKNILRKADEHDIEMASKNAAREEEALKFCKKRVQERKMEMKLVRAEYLFDGSKIVFYFTADGRIDFRELVRDLAQHFRTRIEMRQIGVRDEAKMVGGLGCCGRELCCSSYLRSFAPVSVKMAKAQGLALNPSKISGQCGRLLCCLGYEYDTYNELRKNLPKCGKKLELPDGTADVLSLNILAQKVTLGDRNGRREVHIDDLHKPQKSVAPAEQQKPSHPAAKPGERDKTKTEESKTPRRTRRRGGRGNAARNQNQQNQADKAQTGESKKPVVAKPAEKPAEKKGDEQKSSRPRRRNRRRPRRRPEQGAPQDPKPNT
jgi:cell fate regulator YaaT (PSP1 superfamily)